MTDFRSRLLEPLAAVALALGASAALAHPGHEPGASGSLLAGLLHPLTGMDHLLAMVAVGVWSALVSPSARRALWAPAAFVAWMALGALMGAHGPTLPVTEPMIAGSLLALGLLIAARVALPIWAGALLCGGFALFHGYAHGAEFSGDARGAFPVFVMGFAASTAWLHAMGIVMGFALKRRLAWLARWSGAGVALYGAGLFAAILSGAGA